MLCRCYSYCYVYAIVAISISSIRLCNSSFLIVVLFFIFFYFCSDIMLIISNASGFIMLATILNDKQKSNLREIGIDKLLSVDEVLDHFDTCANVLLVNNSCKYTATPFDVWDIFGLLKNFGNLIFETSKLKKNNPDSFLMEKWKINLGFKNKKEIPYQALFSAMVSDLSEGGDDFKRIFVMYAMITFLAPIPHKFIY